MNTTFKNLTNYALGIAFVSILYVYSAYLVVMLSISQPSWF